MQDHICLKNKKQKAIRFYPQLSVMKHDYYSTHPVRCAYGHFVYPRLVAASRRLSDELKYHKIFRLETIYKLLTQRFTI
jgi:hypothetical protein